MCIRDRAINGVRVRRFPVDAPRDWKRSQRQTHLVTTHQHTLFDEVAWVKNQGPFSSPFFTAIPKRSGGSLMRVYRDTRFSKDKTPYKLEASALVSQAGRKDHNSPGIYFAFGPEAVKCFGGAYQPEKDDGSLEAAIPKSYDLSTLMSDLPGVVPSF